MADRKLVVISDLHISAKELDDFDSELEAHLLRFLDHLASRESAVELVINGDFLDFVQAPPWEGKNLESRSRVGGARLCFTEEQSLEKLAAISEDHEAVFEALRSFLHAKGDNQVVILPGNHDADFFWPGVQRLFLDRVCRGSTQHEEQIRVHLGRMYRSAHFPGVWIEHGHQFDEINSFFLDGNEVWDAKAPPIFEDEQGVERLLECLGTRFMVRFLNRLDVDYPFVDNVKPFSLFVKIFAASAFETGSASLKAAVTVWRLLKFLVRTGVTETTSLMSAQGGEHDATTTLLDRITRLSKRTTELQQRVHQAGFEQDVPLLLVLHDEDKAEKLLDFLSENADLLGDLEADHTGYLGVEGGAGTLTLKRGFSINESAQLIAGAKGIVNDPTIKTVIMGHTHEPKDRPGDVPYLNTGSWTRYYDPRGRETPRSWSVLKEGLVDDFPYQLMYAEVESANVSAARLETFTEKSHVTLPADHQP